MSKLTQERGEAKREAIRKIIYSLVCENAKELNEQAFDKINKHIEAMKHKNPQENHLVVSVCSEIRRDVASFVSKMKQKYGSK